MIISKIETEISNIRNQIVIELSNLQVSLSKSNNINVLKDNLEYILWMKKRYKLKYVIPPNIIKQREVFYCHLGRNIGSEQGSKRPVVIMQNNIGNSCSNTTIIAPITSYENSKIYKDEHNVWYIEYINAKEEDIKRKLDFYEVPIEIEPFSKYKIHGIINVMHLREISKCRLSQVPVAMITTNNYINVIKAINYNLSIL